jgi:hypothetical protein
MTILRSGGIDIFYIDESVRYPNFFATVVRVPFLRNQQSQWRFVWENAYDQADQRRRLLSKRHNVKFRQELHAHEILGRKGLLHKQNRNLTVDESFSLYAEALSSLTFIEDAQYLLSPRPLNRMFLAIKGWTLALYPCFNG